MLRFVYFDMGGVAIKDFSDSNKWRELQESIGVPPEKEKQFLEIWNRHHERECIDYDVDNTVVELNAEMGLQLPPETSLLAEFIKRFEANKSIHSIITSLKKKVRVGLLTNAYPRMLDAIKKKGILPPVVWDVEIDSSIVRLQKPDRAIFDLATKRAAVKTEEILFIDNKKQLIDATKEVGWNTFLYNSGNYERSSKELADYVNTAI